MRYCGVEIEIIRKYARMIKMDCLTAYNGFKKCIIADYPYLIQWDDVVMFDIFEECYNQMMEDHSHIKDPYYSNIEGGIIRLEFLDHYVILCHRISHMLYLNGMIDLADAVYYSLRVRGSIDLYYPAKIGRCFMPGHALCAVIDSHSTYGEFFRIGNDCHVGPYSILGKGRQEIEHPTIGNFVSMLPHSKVYGNSVIGDNVIISVETVIINENIPDDCIVSGSSPNLVFQKLRFSNRDRSIN